MTLGETEIADEERVRSDSVCSARGGDTIDRVLSRRQSWDITERFLPQVCLQYNKNVVLETDDLFALGLIRAGLSILAALCKV